MSSLELNEEVYKELVNILGEKNVSNDPVINQVYAYNYFNEFINLRRGNNPSPFVFSPLAVVLPASTEEVQKVIKLINKVGLKFKPQATGLGAWNCVSSEDVIILDLRRMDKIRKVDLKNMYAVIEPYVTGATLQSELIKYGLNTHMPGAGPQVSPLASSTSMCGPGFTGDVTGYSSRNVLGVEWVLPDGEMLRVGSLRLENNPDWYCGDGPGISLRGVMRGQQGARGGLGVFTACAIKLYPYPCETKWNLKGISPNYEFDIPDYMEFHFINYREWDEIEHALNRFSEEEIGFMVCYTSPLAMATLFSGDREELVKAAASTITLKKPLIVLICAKTKKEFEYKEKVLTELIKETNGKELSARKFVAKSLSYVEALRSMLGYHVFIVTGSFQSSFGGMDSIPLTFQMAKVDVPVKKKYIKQKVLPDDQGKSGWIQTYEYGHYAHAEMPTMYSQDNPESIKGMNEYFLETHDLMLKKHLNVPFFVDGDDLHDLWGPQLCNYNIWLRKIKEAFDSNNTADSGFYISTTQELKKQKERKAK